MVNMMTPSKLLRDLEGAIQRRDKLRAEAEQAEKEVSRLRGQISKLMRGEAPESPGSGTAPEYVRAVVDAFQTAGERIDAAILAQRLAIPPGTARNRLLRAERHGLVKRVARGQYEKVEPGEVIEEVRRASG